VIGRKSKVGEAIRVFLRRIQFSNSSRTRRTLVSVRE
jgi:Amidohydrolase family